MKRIVIIQGHPDTSTQHLGYALGEAYHQGALSAGHEVRSIRVANLEFPLLRSSEDYQHGAVPESLHQAQADIAWANHILILYPLWLGGMPALLKGFLEQILRPGFATSPVKDGRSWNRLLRGRSAHIVITMGMPALFYRWYFRAHSLKSLERNILRFCGIGPFRETLIGSVEALNEAGRGKWLARMRALGRKGA